MEGSFPRRNKIIEDLERIGSNSIFIGACTRQFLSWIFREKRAGAPRSLCIIRIVPCRISLRPGSRIQERGICETLSLARILWQLHTRDYGLHWRIPSAWGEIECRAIMSRPQISERPGIERSFCTPYSYQRRKKAGIKCAPRQFFSDFTDLTSGFTIRKTLEDLFPSERYSRNVRMSRPRLQVPIDRIQCEIFRLALSKENAIAHANHRNN